MADSLIFAAMDAVDAAADAHGVDYLTAAEQLCAHAPYRGLFDPVALAKATRLKFCPSAKLCANAGGGPAPGEDGGGGAVSCVEDRHGGARSWCPGTGEGVAPQGTPCRFSPELTLR